MSELRISTDLLQGGAGLFDPVRHGGPGGLRPAAAHLLPRHQRVPGLLQRGPAHQLREREGKVDPRDQAPLPQNSLPVGGHHAGLQGGPGIHQPAR